MEKTLRCKNEECPEAGSPVVINLTRSEGAWWADDDDLLFCRACDRELE